MLHQKRSELLRLLFIISMLALTVGVVLVLSTNDRVVSVTPSPAIFSGNVSRAINFSITNSEGSDINEVRFTKPGTVGAIFCLNSPPTGWTCTNSSTYVEFTGSTITAGSTTSFNVSINTPSTTGNQSFTVRTLDTSSTNSSEHNMTIDADAPVIFNNSMNLSDGNVTMLNASTLAHGTGWVKLQDLTFNITITDVFDNIINASIYYRNTTTLGEIPSTPPHPDNASSYNDTIRLTSANPATGRYNGTIPANKLNNGTKIFFTIVANDSVANRNVTSLTVLSTNTYNFTVDGAAPLLGAPPNIIREYDAAEDNIITSTVLTTISLNVTDNGGSGVSRVEINASATQGWVNMTRNGSSNADWYYNGSLSQLGVAAGDRNLTIYFRAFDNVSNVNEALTTLNVLVDDDAPTFAIGLFAPSNTTDQTSLQNFTKSNSSVLNFSILIYGNLNYTGGIYANSTVATIMGPDGRVYNLSLLSKTSTWNTTNASVGSGSEMVYSSLWFSAQSPQGQATGTGVDGDLGNLTSTNSTLNTLGCATLNPDGGVCPIIINVTDIFGRSNSTNISITLDNVSAAVSNITTNATGGAVQVVRKGSIINFSLNANNNILNVTIHNASKDAERLNATTLTAMGAAAGNYSIALAANLVCGGGVEGICTVNFSTVDKALNINRSGILNAKAQGASTTFIVDDTAPLVSHFMIEGADSYLNQTGSGGTKILRSDLNVTITFNVSDQITNVTQVRIGNATMRNASFATADIPDGFRNDSTLANFGCPANVESSCILVVQALDNASIDGSKNSNTTVNLTLRVDDLKPRVANFTTNLTYNHRVTSATTLINFTVNVTDANLVNVSVANTTVILMNRSSAAVTDNSTSTVWTVATTLTALGCTADGNCSVTIYANDSAGNVNASQWITVNLDTTTISTVGMNISPATGTANPITYNTPTLWINLTTNSLCSYSTTQVPYASMTVMGGAGTTSHSTTLSAQSDGTYTYYFRCVDNLNVEPSNFLQSTTFTIDTINDTIISIDNRTNNVVFYFDNTPTITVNLSANGVCRYSNSTSGVRNYTTMTMPFDVNGTRHNSFTLAATTDGSYTYDVACATANEQNTVTGTVAFTIDTINDTTITIMNWTNTGSTFIDATPTVHVNTSNSSTCRYSNVTGTTVFNDMKMPFAVNGTRHNSFTISGDLRDNDNYAYPVACMTANEQNEVRETVRFTVDTTSLWNITIGATGSLSAAKDYFTQANRFYTFRLPKTNILSTTAVATTYNVSNVLASLVSANPSGSTNNLSILYAYDRVANTWTSYVPGRASGNDFNNFTTDTKDYYANFTVANERIEIN